MVILFVVPEISGGVEPIPPDAIKLSEKADAVKKHNLGQDPKHV